MIIRTHLCPNANFCGFWVKAAKKMWYRYVLGNSEFGLVNTLALIEMISTRLTKFQDLSRYIISSWFETKRWGTVAILERKVGQGKTHHQMPSAFDAVVTEPENNKLLVSCMCTGGHSSFNLEHHSWSKSHKYCINILVVIK